MDKVNVYKCFYYYFVPNSWEMYIGENTKYSLSFIAKTSDVFQINKYYFVLILLYQPWHRNARVKTQTLDSTYRYAK